MVTLRSFQCFVAVAEELHFTRAADRLHMTQSALSVQIRRLEDQLGARLLNRTKRSAVSLTTAGELLLPEARRTLDQAATATNLGRRAGRGEIGHVKISFVASAVFSSVLPTVLSRFHRDHQDVSVELTELDTPAQLDAVRKGAVDIGVIRPHPVKVPGSTTREIHSERLMIALPDNHPAASKTALRAGDVARDIFIEPQFDGGIGFEEYVTLFLGSMPDPDRYRKVDDFLTALSLVSAGYGVSLVPRSAACLTVSGVTYRRLDAELADVKLLAIYRPDELSEAADALTRYLTAP